MDKCKIKICGLTRFVDISAVNRAIPDYIGFVFAKSRRRVTPGEARLLKRRLDPRIQAVGVFVNAPIEEILSLASGGKDEGRLIDFIQLHGNEDQAYIRALKSATRVPVIKALKVQSRAQILKSQELPCDFLLLDACVPNTYGGSGASFDWKMIPPLSKPYFLAGGINRGNLARAAALHPYGLDISSGAETDGRKDPVKIEELVRLGRQL